MKSPAFILCVLLPSLQVTYRRPHSCFGSYSSGPAQTERFSYHFLTALGFRSFNFKFNGQCAKVPNLDHVALRLMVAGCKFSLATCFGAHVILFSCDGCGSASLCDSICWNFSCRVPRMSIVAIKSGKERHTILTVVQGHIEWLKFCCVSVFMIHLTLNFVSLCPACLCAPFCFAQKLCV